LSWATEFTSGAWRSPRPIAETPFCAPTRAADLPRLFLLAELAAGHYRASRGTSYLIYLSARSAVPIPARLPAYAVLWGYALQAPDPLANERHGRWDLGVIPTESCDYRPSFWAIVKELFIHVGGHSPEAGLSLDRKSPGPSCPGGNRQGPVVPRPLRHSTPMFPHAKEIIACPQ
jgi:hypothetical protein